MNIIFPHFSSPYLHTHSPLTLCIRFLPPTFLPFPFPCLSVKKISTPNYFLFSQPKNHNPWLFQLDHNPSLSYSFSSNLPSFLSSTYPFTVSSFISLSLHSLPFFLFRYYTHSLCFSFISFSMYPFFQLFFWLLCFRYCYLLHSSQLCHFHLLLLLSHCLIF